MSESPRGAQSAIRAIRLLKLFTPEQPELRLAELSERSGLNETTAHRLLQALVSESMLDRHASAGTYRLGPGLVALGMQVMSSGNLRLAARPLLRRLAAAIVACGHGDGDCPRRPLNRLIRQGVSQTRTLNRRMRHDRRVAAGRIEGHSL